MKICHVCGATFEDYVDICTDCGATLMTEEEVKAAEEAEKKEAEALIKNPVLLETVEDMIVAEILSDMLKEANIRFYCEESASMMTGFGGSFMAVKVYVDERDLAAATEIYKNLAESNIVFDGEDDSFDGE